MFDKTKTTFNRSVGKKGVPTAIRPKDSAFDKKIQTGARKMAVKPTKKGIGKNVSTPTAKKLLQVKWQEQ